MITADGVPTAEMDYVALNVILNQAWATGEIGWDLGPFTKVLAPAQKLTQNNYRLEFRIKNFKTPKENMGSNHLDADLGNNVFCI